MWGNSAYHQHSSLELLAARVLHPLWHCCWHQTWNTRLCCVWGWGKVCVFMGMWVVCMRVYGYVCGVCVCVCGVCVCVCGVCVCVWCVCVCVCMCVVCVCCNRRSAEAIWPQIKHWLISRLSSSDWVAREECYWTTVLATGRNTSYWACWTRLRWRYRLSCGGR